MKNGIWHIYGGKKWDNGHFVKHDESTLEVENEADADFQLSDDDLWVPGVIDFHAHIWAPLSKIGISDAQLYAEGVVGCVDAGSYGYNDWFTADRFWKNASPQEIRSFVSVLPEGLTVFPPKNTTPPEKISVEKLVEIGKKADQGRLLGYKVHLGWKDATNDRGLLKVAREAADRTGLKVLVHISGSELPLSEIISYMRKGDIIAHCYTGTGTTILENGVVREAFFEAKKKGIIMDVAHAGKHFVWPVYDQAMKEGAYFDTLGTDITKMSYKNTEQFKLLDIFHLISAMLNTGVPLDSAFKAVLDTPADCMGITLKPDKHILILKKVEGEIAYADGVGSEIMGSYEYKPFIFIDNGKLIYKQ